MIKINVKKCGLDKLKELILYVAQNSKDDYKFGAIKLNKILYYADFAAYRQLGKSITGAEYQNLPEGPAPKQLLPCRDELIREGDAKIEYRQYFEGTQQRLVAKRAPKLKEFTKKELEIVDEVIEGFRAYNGKEVSLKSHDEYGWLLTSEGETIPYSSSFFSSEPLTGEQVELGKQIAKKHALIK